MVPRSCYGDIVPRTTDRARSPPEAPSPAIKDAVKKEWFGLLALHPSCDFHGQHSKGRPRRDGWLRCWCRAGKPPGESETANKMFVIEIRTPKYTFTLCGHQTAAGSESRSELPCLHLCCRKGCDGRDWASLLMFTFSRHRGGWRENEGKMETEGENYLQLWLCSPKSPKPEHFWARTQHIMATIWGLEHFLRGVFAYISCGWVRGRQHDAKGLLSPLCLCFSALQQKRLQAMNVRVNS